MMTAVNCGHSDPHRALVWQVCHDVQLKQEEAKMFCASPCLFFAAVANVREKVRVLLVTVYATAFMLICFKMDMLTLSILL